MTSKELRAILKKAICEGVDESSWLVKETEEVLDLYTVALHAEGVAEERERIRGIVCPDEDEHGDLTIGWLSLSVLAPTKVKP